MSIPRVKRSTNVVPPVSMTCHGDPTIRHSLTRTDEITASTSSKVMEHPVSMSLKHLGVGVEARVAEFGNLLGEEFDSVGGVAEDD